MAHHRLADMQPVEQFSRAHPNLSIAKIVQQVSRFEPHWLSAGVAHLLQFNSQPLGHFLYQHLEAIPNDF